ncbi:MAG TPA: hypothetical protein VGJ83_07855 [Gemmatimonadales bacterium]
MTETAARLRRLARPHVGARALGIVLWSVGAAAAAAALGLALAPRLAGVALAWALIAASAVGAAWAVRRARHEGDAPVVGRLAEAAAGTRAGSIVGVVDPRPSAAAGASSALFAAADRRAAVAVERAAPAMRALLARTTRRRLAFGAAALLTGAALLLVASPAAGRAAAFWNPLGAWRDAHSPVRLAVDRGSVRRGDSITVTVTARGATRAVLWTRGPGEPWRPAALLLDTQGRAARRLGPLDSDLFVRAASGGRRSAELKIEVALPAFLADLALTARYPAYLARGEEPLLPGPDTVLLPVGTEIVASGTASVPLGEAAWRGGTRVARLRVDGPKVEGRFTPVTSGVWSLSLRAADDTPLEGPAPELHVVLVPDSTPIVAVPVPGRDTALPISLRQPLVVDVRDDHGITRLDVVSWRVSRTGRVGTPVHESLDVSGVGDRAIVQGQLDAQQRGLLPGDTLRMYVEAWDNAPARQRGRSPEIALRLPSMEELRAEARAAARAVAGSADSVAAAQRELSERTRDLAQERTRDAGAGSRQPGNQAGTLPFQAQQRAEEIARQQAAMSERVAELARAVEEIARAAHAAGVDDTAFQNRLREVQQLLERALTPELEQRLQELQEALARLDPEATRQALQRLAEAQQQLRRELERSEELFRRAAIEGELTSLAKDAEELERRQSEWTREDAPRADSAAAAAERAIAERTDSLAKGLAQAEQDLARTPGAQPLAEPQAAARRAREAMQEAANAADQRNARGARRQGQEAADSLGRLPKQLRGQRDSLAAAWKEETLVALDRALGETAALAARQQELAEGLRRGEAGAAPRARQAAVEEGTQVVEREVSEAAGRHALVPPQLEAALGMAQNQMRLALEQLEQGEPNAATAALYAEQALDALNATALALLRTSQDVAGAQSGSGFQEAVEQLARMAGQQQGLNGDAQGLLPMMMPGGGAVMEKIRELAARQRALAEQLERLQAQGASSAAGALAAEARELARQLENGRLDQRTVERQERLYRRLLDAGRTLSGAEPDEEKERVSRSATGDSVRIPGLLAPGATGGGPRLRYPTWDELSRLTPEQRRLVLEYFRRLNEPPR